MTVTVAIPTLGRDTLFHTIASLKAQTSAPDEVLIVHQGDSAIAPQIEQAYPEARVLIQEVKGLSRARNAAMRAATSDWVFWTDDDQEVAPDWVENLRKLAHAYPKVGIMAGSVLPPVEMPEGYHCDQLSVLEDTLIDKHNYLEPPVQHRNIHHNFWGGNIALTKELYEDVGPFDEELGRGATFPVGEDVDYAARVISRGHLGMLSPRLVIYHTYGARPAHINTSDDNVVTSAIMLWKAEKQPGLLLPEITSKLLPYGRKKLVLARLTRGASFGEHLDRFKLFEATMERLEREYGLENGCLVKRGS
jgi:GT2 family glycosyltransferase